MGKIFAVIPARYGSSRFPGKPLAVIKNRTLIEWTYINAKKCKILDRVIVATDDKRIFDIVTSFGGEACLTSENHLSGTDRIAETAKKLKFAQDSIVINIQGDEPLTDPEAIKKLAEAMIEQRNLRMATLSCRIKTADELQNPNYVKVVVDKDGFALYFSRSPVPFPENFEKAVFRRHIGIYAYRKKFLLEFSRMKPGELEKQEKLEQLRALENKIKIKVIESSSAFASVDVPEDIARVEAMMA